MRSLAILRNLFASPALPEQFSLALDWVLRYSNASAGIAVNSECLRPYPEVSGYFIPTLLRWGERDLALSYARWLITIQNKDGSWSDPEGVSPYTFDTGQILKGLLELADYLSEFEEPILRGCEWIAANILSSGRVVTPDMSCWGLPGGKTVPESIHVYALEPLVRAGKRYDISRYGDLVQQAINYYSSDETIQFQTLGHFHAYIVEAFIDLNRPDIARRALNSVVSLKRRSGFIPAYPNVSWCCSTAQFQYAVSWYKLGEKQHADRAFDYGCRLQNLSGGFYGSYGMGANYFPKTEISWANKYFLDALWWKIRSSFDIESEIFPESIDVSDGRYLLIANLIRLRSPRKILDAGCGKGRFLRFLQIEFPGVQFSGLDLSQKMLNTLPTGVKSICGSLLDIPLEDSQYDLVFCIEALEHAVNFSCAIRELCRIVAPGGVLVIIDKNRERLGRLKISDWEQWFDKHHITDLLQKEGFVVHVEQNISYNNRDGSDGLFIGWVATKI